MATHLQQAFIGRERELSELEALLGKKSSSLVVVKGRRRVGKSRLLNEFIQGKRAYKFIGLAPYDGATAQDQRDEFARQLQTITGLPQVATDDWGMLFSLLGHELKRSTKPTVVIFDEVSWMADQSSAFLSQLKTVWDEQWQQHPKLILILCSSVSVWMEDNILNSTGFYGRVSWSLTLKPLPLPDCKRLLKSQGWQGSTYETFKLLSVTGGVPWYIEQMQGQYTADDNIKRQCFSSGGVLFHEFDQIFKDIFGKKEAIYKHIVSALMSGPLDYKELSGKTNYKSSGRLSDYLDNLIAAGFISRDYTWQLRSGKISKISHFRLSDNYLRFYLKYIQPRKIHIQQDRFSDVGLSSLPGWNSIMGFQFENLVLNNRDQLLELLHIQPDQVVADNPFVQRKTQEHAGCQIDYLIQTQYHNLYACEIKFSKDPLRKGVIREVKDKIDRISLPRGMAVLPVLIHVNSIDESISDAGYFHRIVDFSELLS